jgi:two-component system response regulator RegA
MSAPRSILVVDDDEAFRSRLVRAFRDRGYAAVGAADLPQTRLLVHAALPDFAVVDLRIGEASGLDVVRELRERAPAVRVVMLTGYGSIATALEAVRLGALDYLTKPADADQILATLLRDGAPAPPVAPTPAPESVPSLERVEWEHIQRVLADCGGNISHAARALGIHRRTLQRKLANHPPPR